MAKGRGPNTMGTVVPTNNPGCCGPITDRIQIIKQVSRGLRDGHHGIAQLYAAIADDIEDPEEKKQFKDKAAEHRRMGDESLKILLPDGTEDGEG